MTPTTEQTATTKPAAKREPKKAPAKKSARKPRPSTGGLADATAEAKAIDAVVERTEAKARAKLDAAKTKPARKRKAQEPKAPRVLKRDQLEAMLRHPQGAKITEICTALQIQPHSARAAISTMGKRFGTKVELIEGVYRLPPTEA